MTSLHPALHYSMIVQWSVEDACFVTTLPEFNHARTHGETYQQAVEMGVELIESFLIWYEQDGKILPKPVLYQSVAG
jgi:antitoxin HicB